MRQLSFNTFVYKAYIICVFLLFLNAMYPWYMWTNKLSALTLLLTGGVSILLFITSPSKFVLTKVNVGLIMVMMLALLWQSIHQVSISFVFVFIVWVVLLSLRSDLKKEVLSRITKWFAILLLISLLFYIAFLLGFSISPSYIEFEGRYPTLNYIFFTLPVDQFSAYRFKSIFMEPGHLTMGLVPLIMANRFNLKNKYVLILFIAELFTFSLAGYITMFIGYVLFNISLRRLKYLFYGALFIVVAIYVFDRTSSSDVLDRFLWSRLEYSDGNIAGNNRTTDSFDMIYNDVMRTSDKWAGREGIDIMAYGGISGYKKYIVQYGLIGVLFALLLYSYSFLVYRKYDIGVLTLILLLLLYQNAYPFWFAVMSMYILGTFNLKNRTSNG